MSNMDERMELAIDALLQKATEDHSAATAEAVRAAYRRGFQDGIWHVLRTARRELSAETPAPMPSRENPFSQAATTAPEMAAKRAPYGLCRRAIAEAFKSAGDSGIDIEMVIETGFRMEGGPRLASSSVRSTLIDMKNAKEIDRRGGRWYRVSRPESETTGNAQEADPAAPFIHNQGGHNGAALVN